MIREESLKCEASNNIEKQKPKLMNKEQLIELIKEMPEHTKYAVKEVETQLGKHDAYYISITSMPIYKDQKK